MKPQLAPLRFDEFTAAEIGQGEDPRARADVFVATLRAVAAPFPVPELHCADLKGLSFFFTCRREVGLGRYWLQLGYFASLADARRCLERLRPLYPRAFVTATAPVDTPLLTEAP